MDTQAIIAAIAVLCIKTGQILDKEEKITCIDYYTNCIINSKEYETLNSAVTKCKKGFIINGTDK